MGKGQCTRTPLTAKTDPILQNGGKAESFPVTVAPGILSFQLLDVDLVRSMPSSPAFFMVYDPEITDWVNIGLHHDIPVRFGRPVLLKMRPCGLASPPFEDCPGVEEHLRVIHGCVPRTSGSSTTRKRSGDEPNLPTSKAARTSGSSPASSLRLATSVSGLDASSLAPPQDGLPTRPDSPATRPASPAPSPPTANAWPGVLSTRVFADGINELERAARELRKPLRTVFPVAFPTHRLPGKTTLYKFLGLWDAADADPDLRKIRDSYIANGDSAAGSVKTYFEVVEKSMQWRTLVSKGYRRKDIPQRTAGPSIASPMQEPSIDLTLEDVCWFHVSLVLVANLCCRTVPRWSRAPCAPSATTPCRSCRPSTWLPCSSRRATQHAQLRRILTRIIVSATFPPGRMFAHSTSSSRSSFPRLARAAGLRPTSTPLPHVSRPWCHSSATLCSRPTSGSSTSPVFSVASVSHIRVSAPCHGTTCPPFAKPEPGSEYLIPLACFLANHNCSYGAEGHLIVLATVRRLLRHSVLSDNTLLLAGVTWDDVLSHVAVPEIVVFLIRQDLGLDHPAAVDTYYASRCFGLLAHPQLDTPAAKRALEGFLALAPVQPAQELVRIKTEPVEDYTATALAATGFVERQREVDGRVEVYLELED
jgi:hypothetical protein